MFVAGSSENEITSAIPFQHYPIFSSSPFRYINPMNVIRMNRIIQEQNIQAIVLDHPYLAWMALWLKRKNNLVLILRSHNVEYLRFKSLKKPWWFLVKLYETWAHKHADYIWCVTREDRLQITKDIGHRPVNMVDVPFGTELNQAPADKAACKQWLEEKYQLAPGTKIILYNGTLHYGPNRIGLDAILEVVNPALLQQEVPYKIIICGSKLPESYNELKAYTEANVIYAGFVDDVSIYFKGADLFLNPVIGGGGIKTKLIEALAFNTQVISARSGAIGLCTEVAGDMIQVVDDFDWTTFTEKVLQAIQQPSSPNIPQAYYDYYNWQKNITRALNEIHPK